MTIWRQMMDEKNKVRLKYYECNMTKGQHMLAYLFFSVMIGVVLFIYYRFIPVAVIGGFIIGIWQEEQLFPDCDKETPGKTETSI